MNQSEQKVFEALGDERWDWRTLAGLKESTGLPGPVILEIILGNTSKVEMDVSPTRDNLLFRLKRKDEGRGSIVDEALDILALGARDRLA